MYYPLVNYCKAVKLFHGSVSWQKQVMDKGQNLIDFGEKGENAHMATLVNANAISNSTIPVNVPYSENVNSNTVVSHSEPTGTVGAAAPSKTKNKSLFEITRVEATHGENENAGDNDSEFDDTFSETHDSSSTSIQVENIMKHDDSQENATNAIDVVDHTKPLTVSVESQPPTTCDSTTSSASSTPPVSAAPAASSEPPSRFRIVKITKNKPYEKGKWSVSDYQDSQRQVESVNDIPASPVVKRNTTNTHSLSSNHNHKQSSESSGEQKITENNNKDISSPNTNMTELVKTKSSTELFTTVVNSRGSSYNAVIGERRSSHDSCITTTAPDSVSPTLATPNVTPMVEALESALDQIHSIKESMLQSFTDEMKRLKENIVTLQTENSVLKEENETFKRLKEENESLKKRIVYLEEQIKIDKG